MIPTESYYNKGKGYLPKFSNTQQFSKLENKYDNQNGRIFHLDKTVRWDNRQNYEPLPNFSATTNYQNIRRKQNKTHNTYHQRPYENKTPLKQANSFYKSTVSKPINQKMYESTQLSNLTNQYDQSKNKNYAKSSKNIPLYQRLKNVDYSKQQQKNRNNFLNDTYQSRQSRFYEDTSLKKTAHEEKTPEYRVDKSAKKSAKKINSWSIKRINSYDQRVVDAYEEEDLRVTPGFGRVQELNDKKTEIFREPKLDDFILGQCKGEGRFGKVYIAVHRRSGFVCALKKIRKQSVKFMIDQFIQQLKIQQFLSHPNLVKIYGYFADKQNFYMLVQYMEEGSLYSLMKKNGKKLSEEQTAKKMYEICSGIQYMHEREIVHRDMKPENIVLTHGVCKICDFGWAAVCQDRRNTYCGTLDYVCPQIANGKDYDSSVDIWCLGVLAYQMLAGKAPFYNISRQKTIQNIKTCKIESFPSHFSRSSVKFISMILQKDPEHRVGISELLNSQFLKNIQK